MEASLTQVLTALVAAAVIGVVRLTFMVRSLDQAIRGLDGKNGLVGTTAELRRRTHHLAHVIDWVSNRTYDLERIEGIESRPMPRPAE